MVSNPDHSLHLFFYTMILEDNINADNNFCKAYDALDNETKARIRELITGHCDINEKTFYSWLKRPELVKGKPNQRFIAYLLFNRKVKEFFTGE